MIERKSIVFSVLFNEDPVFLQYLVFNFLCHTPDDCALIVNTGVSVEKHWESTRNPRISIITAQKARAKQGLSLLIGHCESFEFAKSNIHQFSFFVPIASNSLFVRHLMIESVLTELNERRDKGAIISLESPPESHFEWPHYHGLRPHLASDSSQFKHALIRNGINYLKLSQIEGLISSFDNWERVVNVARDIEPNHSNMPVPLEEVIPVAVFNQLGDGRYTHLCRNMWRNAPYNKTGETFVDTKLLLDEVSLLPPNIFLLKWFRRSASSFETWLVCTEDGITVRDSLRKIIGSRLSGPRLSQLAYLFNGLSDSSGRTIQEFRPTSTSDFNGEFYATRSIGPVAAPGDDNGGFVFFEDTKELIKLSIDVDKFGAIAIHSEPIVPGSLPAQPPRAIVAYFYFSIAEYMSAEKNVLMVNMSSSEPILDTDLKLWTRLTSCDSTGKYSVLPCVGRSTLRYSITTAYNLEVDSGLSHIGLPIIMASHVRWSFNVETHLNSG